MYKRQILDPKESAHKWYCGRDEKALTKLESSLQAWKRHPVLRLLKVEHTLHGLPLIATEDASSLLGAGKGGARLFPWRVRSLRGQANAFAATLPPPPPPTDYSPVKQADSYAPPKAYEAGANMFGAQPQHSLLTALAALSPPASFDLYTDMSKIINPTQYGGVRPPPPPPPSEKHG